MQRLSIVVLAALAVVLSIAALGVAWGAASKVGRAAQGSPVPTTVAYQGFLTDIKGNPVPNGARTVTFRLYSGATGGSALWQETQTITTDRGVFNALLGSGTAFGSVFDTAPLHLGVQIAGEPELRPRQQLSATPFALRAADADTLGGVPAASFVRNAGTGLETTQILGQRALVVAPDYRLPQNCNAGKVAKWAFTSLSTMGWICGADIAGGDVDTSSFQTRITGRCAVPRAMRGVNADGTPDCFGPLAGASHTHPVPEVPRIELHTEVEFKNNHTRFPLLLTLQPHCQPDESVVGGGFGVEDNEIPGVVVQSVPFVFGNQPDSWLVRMMAPARREVYAFALCMKLVQP